MRSIERDGCFKMCLPEAYYSVSLTGDAISLPVDLKLPETSHINIDGFATDIVKAAPPAIALLTTSLAALVSDIVANNPTIIGLGEATHGTAEFASVRGELSLALIKNAEVQLLLFEVDAISAVALDEYVNGADIDIAKAVAALGFWVTDTYEFLAFLRLVRDYNASSSDKVHIWGVDLQDTELPVKVLIGNAATLSIDPEDQATLQIAATRRGKGIANLPAAQRVRLMDLLSRLAVPRARNQKDLLIAVAARSLVMQLGYLDGDMLGQYRRRRDAGMAHLAAFIASQLGVKRACLWAHDGHIAKEGSVPMLGQNLASTPTVRYYGIGFYLYEGSARAWDATAKIGVISHAIPAAPPYTMEGAVMRATKMQGVAWIPLRNLPIAFRNWLDTPRFVREVGAAYVDYEDTLTLRHIRQAFDAVVVIRTGHDSTPTPTGVRKVVHD